MKITCDGQNTQYNSVEYKYALLTIFKARTDKGLVYFCFSMINWVFR